MNGILTGVRRLFYLFTAIVLLLPVVSNAAERMRITATDPQCRILKFEDGKWQRESISSYEGKVVVTHRQTATSWVFKENGAWRSGKPECFSPVYGTGSAGGSSGSGGSSSYASSYSPRGKSWFLGAGLLTFNAGVKHANGSDYAIKMRSFLLRAGMQKNLTYRGSSKITPFVNGSILMGLTSVTEPADAPFRYRVSQIGSIGVGSALGFKYRLSPSFKMGLQGGLDIFRVPLESLPTSVRKRTAFHFLWGADVLTEYRLPSGRTSLLLNIGFSDSPSNLRFLAGAAFPL